MRSRDQTFECAGGIWELLRLKEVKEKSGVSSFILAKNFFFQFKADLHYKIQEIRLEIMLTFFFLFSFFFHPVIFSKVCIPDN